MNALRLPLLPALALTLAASPLAAQVSLGVTAHTELRVTGGLLDTIAAGTDLTAGASLQSSSSNNGCTASGSMSVTVTQDGTDATLKFRNSADGSCAVFGYVNATAGAHSILATLQASQPTAGRLIIRVSPVDNGSHAYGTWSASSAVDVHNDGSVELSGKNGLSLFGYSGELEIPVVLDSNGLQVRVDAAVSISGTTPNFAGAHIDVMFRTSPGRIAPYGTSCGPVLTAAHRKDGANATLEFSMETSQFLSFQPFAYVVFGLNQLNLPIPQSDGSTCPLLTEIIVPKAVIVDVVSGRAQLTIPVPGPYEFRAQFLMAVPNAYGSYDWRTSNGLHLRL